MTSIRRIVKFRQANTVEDDVKATISYARRVGIDHNPFMPNRF